MPTDYKEELAKYKYDKAVPLDDLPIAGRKKKQRKHKKADHKHTYIPGIFYTPHDKYIPMGYGFYCETCGRIQDVHFCWQSYLEKEKAFEDQYPNARQIILPEDWRWFLDKYIPIGE